MENFTYALSFDELLEGGKMPFFIDRDRIYFLNSEILDDVLKKCEFQHSKSFNIPDVGSLKVYADNDGNSIIVKIGIGAYEKVIGEYKVSIEGIVADRVTILYEGSGAWGEIDLGQLLCIYQNNGLSKIISRTKLLLEKRKKEISKMYV